MHIPYLQQSRTGIYYFRLVIPKALRATVGRRELRRSLRTRDLPQAILRMRRYLDEVSYAFQEQKMKFDLDELKKATASGQFKSKVTRGPDNTVTVEGEADANNPKDGEALQQTTPISVQAIQDGAPQAPSAPPIANNPAPIVPVTPQTPPQPSSQAAGSVTGVNLH